MGWADYEMLGYALYQHGTGTCCPRVMICISGTCNHNPAAPAYMRRAEPWGRVWCQPNCGQGLPGAGLQVLHHHGWVAVPWKWASVTWLVSPWTSANLLGQGQPLFRKVSRKPCIMFLMIVHSYLGPSLQRSGHSGHSATQGSRQRCYPYNMLSTTLIRFQKYDSVSSLLRWEAQVCPTTTLTSKRCRRSRCLNATMH